MLKAKEFAKEQREKAARKAQQKKMAKAEEANQPVETHPHAFKTTHTVRSRADILSSDLPDDIVMPKKGGNMTILEQDLEESEISVNAVNIESNEARMFPKRQIEEKTQIINKYKRIDQMTLNRVGLKQK